MIRDTFETNPGLCELFKRKILERAQSAGLSSDLIDFDSQIDMKGTFKDNLQIFYREYPQLAQDSDYLRFKSPRPLTGIVVEQAWRSYKRSNGRAEQPIGMETIMPELTVTYTVDLQPPSAGKEAPNEGRVISRKPVPSQGEANETLWAHMELTKLLLDRVTAMAAENVTKAILQQLGRETEWTAFHHARDKEPPGNLIAAENEIAPQPSSATLMSFSDDCSNRVVSHRYCSQCGAPLRQAVKKTYHSAAAIAFVAGLVHADGRLGENMPLK